MSDPCEEMRNEMDEVMRDRSFYSALQGNFWSKEGAKQQLDAALGRHASALSRVRDRFRNRVLYDGFDGWLQGFLAQTKDAWEENINERARCCSGDGSGWKGDISKQSTAL
jgi:hypothetical protein